MKINAIFLAALLPATCVTPLMAQSAQWSNPPAGQASGRSPQEAQDQNDSGQPLSGDTLSGDTARPDAYPPDAYPDEPRMSGDQAPYRRHPHPHRPPTDPRLSASSSPAPGCDCDADRGYPMPGQPVSRVIPHDIDNGQACDDMQETSPPPTHLAAYPVPEGTEVVICSGPGTPPGLNAGSPPPFRSLDTNGNGWIDESEASAYPPLANDFLYASHGKSTLNRASYERWASHVLRQDGGARDEAWQDHPASGDTDEN